MVERFPQFFIVGAPKSGTTSLLNYLDDHPEVFVPERNEMHYFGTDLGIKGTITSRQQYLDFFASATPRQLVGEKSVFYLFSEQAAEEISKEQADAKIIVLLRHPADMIYSLHGQFLYSGNEDCLQLADALVLEAQRARGERLPACAHNPRALEYTKVGAYRKQIERYLESFGAARVHVQLFDTLRDDPRQWYADIALFLDIDASFKPTFDTHNAAHAVPHLGARRLLRSRPALHRLAHRLTPPAVRDKVRDSLSRRQSQRPSRIDPATRSALTRLLSDDIYWLRDVLRLPVDHWL